MANNNLGSFAALQTPFLDPKAKTISWTWLQQMRVWQQLLAAGFDPGGNLKSNLLPTVQIVGRDGTIGSILQNVDQSGIVQAAGLVPATDTTQGAVILPAGATSNTLGGAAIEPVSAFDPAGAAATAQANAETFATEAADTAQSNAEAFASDASNLTSGTVSTDRLSGFNGTVSLAALTATGTQGSLTVTNGLITAAVDPT